MIYGLQAAGRARFLHPLGFCILQGLELYEKNGGARGGEKERCDSDGAGPQSPRKGGGCCFGVGANSVARESGAGAGTYSVTSGCAGTGRCADGCTGDSEKG